MNYDQFLQNKKRTISESGFRVELDDLHTMLFPFLKFCVQTALINGKFAFFLD